MFRNEHGRSFLNDAVRGGRGTTGMKSSARINLYGDTLMGNDMLVKNRKLIYSKYYVS